MAANVFLIPTLTNFDLESSLSNLIENEIALISDTLTEFEDGSTFDLTGRSPPDTVGYGFQFDVIEDKTTDGLHLDVCLRADVISIDMNSTSLSTNPQYTAPNIWMFGNLAKYSGGHQTWLYNDRESKSRLRSLDVALGWGPTNGWQVSADLHDACLFGNRSYLDDAWNLMTASSGQLPSTGFDELLNLFLSTQVITGTPTYLDRLMNILQALGVASQVTNDDGDNVWYIDAPALQTLIDTTTDFFDACFRSSSGQFNLSPLWRAIGELKHIIPVDSGISIASDHVCASCGASKTVDGATCSCGSSDDAYNLKLDLTSHILPADSALSVEFSSAGQVSMNITEWKLAENIWMSFGFGLEFDHSILEPSLNFELSFGVPNAGALNHGSISIQWFYRRFFREL